jgi:hypothetical protein
MIACRVMMQPGEIESKAVEALGEQQQRGLARKPCDLNPR